MLFSLGLEVGDVNVAIVVTGNDNDFQIAHLRGSRVGSVRRTRDQADFAMAFATAGMVAADRHDTGVFALRTGVRLHTDGVEPGDDSEPAFQAADHFHVALRLIDRSEGVNVAELRPGDRNHFTGGVELHRAGAERDHRVIERQILVLQTLEVAQHFVLGVIAVEHRVREDRVGTAYGFRHRSVGLLGQCVEGFDVEVDPGNQFDQGDDIITRGLFVDRNTENARLDLAQVVAGVQSGLVGGESFAAEIQMNRVEELLGDDVDTGTLEAQGQNVRQAMDAFSNGAQTLRTVIDGIHAGHVGEQHLRSADVGVGFFAADVLFAGLQGHTQGLVATGIN